MNALPASIVSNPKVQEPDESFFSKTLKAVPPTKPEYRISAIVTAYNEAKNIGACIESLLWCDEILVVDSFSTDQTVTVAKSYERVRVLQRNYLGGASQKNWAIDRVSNDWVLILDADERVTPELREEIENQFSASPSAYAFAINRRTFALGSKVRFSGWQHDRVTRLFRRDAARYPNRRVHADMLTQAPPAVLSSPLDHYMVDDLREYIQRVRRYAFWGAAQLWRDGRRAGPWEIYVRPAWRFLRTYLLQLGILEGSLGLTMCGVQAYGAFLKYTTLWKWRKDLRRGRGPELPDFDEDESTWTWPKSH